MKSSNINTILQIVAILFLVIIGYMSFSSGSNWKIIKSELERAREELETSKDTLAVTKANLKTSIKEISKLKLQKDLITHKRDSIVLEFERKNAKDWEDLTSIKNSIEETNIRIKMEQKLLDSLFGI